MSPRRRRLRRQSRIDLALAIFAGLLPYLVAALVVLISDLRPARGDDSRPDSRREVLTREPYLDGTRASAPIPARYHVRNEGGSNGAGLCVISSTLAAGMAQGVPGLDTPGYEEVYDPATGRMVPGKVVPGKGSLLWKTAKQRPGGYSPDKLQALLAETVPGEKYASYVGTDLGVVEKLVAQGYPVAATMNTGEQYGMRPIHHMVDVGHLDRANDLAMVEDNNRPGIFTWMTAREYGRRFVDGDVGWAFVWLRRDTSGNPAEVAAIGCMLALIISLAIARRLSNRAVADVPATDVELDRYFTGEYADEW